MEEDLNKSMQFIVIKRWGLSGINDKSQRTTRYMKLEQSVVSPESIYDILI